MLHYINGDATEPIETPAIVAHVVNNRGMWGRGFTHALNQKWPNIEGLYRQWYAERHIPSQLLIWAPFILGEVQIIPAVEGTIWVANLLAQNGYRSRFNPQPVVYASLAKCLAVVDQFALADNHTSIHMPRIGCGLGGGEWTVVENLLKPLKSNIFVYDLQRS